MSEAPSFSEVRLGLVAVGLAFVVVGGGLVASLFLFSSASPPGALSRVVTASQIAPNQTQSWSLDTVATTAGSLTLTWSSTVRTNVAFYRATACSSGVGLCPTDPALAEWAAVVSGSWKTSGSLASAYFVAATDASSGPADFNATLGETYAGTPFGLPTPTLVLVTIGCVLLLATGAIGVFLGLFLPGSVYRGRPPEGPYPPIAEDDLDVDFEAPEDEN